MKTENEERRFEKRAAQHSRRALRLLLSSIAVLFIISMISAVSAEGCCFSPDDGLCAMNAERSSCESLGGEFYESSLCLIEKCQKGCCMLGTTSAYTTQRACEVLGSAYGFSSVSFQSGISVEECSAALSRKDLGACVYTSASGYDRTCIFTTREQCAGDFRAGLLCSDSSLDTDCKKTTKTKCFDGDVYLVDTCGNRDAIKTDCDYARGTVCRQETRDSARCISIDCGAVDGAERKNGDKWCIGPDGTAMDKPIEDYIMLATTEDGGKTFVPNVIRYAYTITIPSSFGGGIHRTLEFRVFSKADYWGGIPSGESGIVINADNSTRYVNVNEIVRKGSGGGDVACAGEHGKKITWTTPDTGKTVEMYEDGWQPEVDMAVSAALPNLGLAGEITGLSVFVESYHEPLDISVGSNFARKYCLDGEVRTESCYNYREQYCSGGECMNNPWDACLSSESEEECDTENCFMLEPKTNFGTLGDIRCRGYVETEGEEEEPEETGENEEIEEPMCLPKISGASAEFCEQADLEISGMLVHKVKKDVAEQEKEAARKHGFRLSRVAYYATPMGPLIRALANQEGSGWCSNDDGYGADKGTCAYFDEEWWAQKGVPNIAPGVPGYLLAQCRALGDCDSRVNWIGESGGSGFEVDFDSKQVHKSTSGGTTSTERVRRYYKADFEFGCKEWLAPSGSSDCSKCSRDGFPCTQYRCEALGRGCDYYEPDGVDRGYCVASSDSRAPVVVSHSLNPQSPIPPFRNVEITLNTDEVSSCRFSLTGGAQDFDELPYSIGDSWATEHKTTLYLPGQKKEVEGEEESGYELITEDGKYEMYVRCTDIAGNPNYAPYLITFEVQNTPDYIAPVILEFEPASGSAAKYNSSEKEIRFKINEPAECKWSKTDAEFSSMADEFSCDEAEGDYGLIHGYNCNGVLSGINPAPGSSTTFYIKCKDQPYLEGHEDSMYKRNVNEKSTEYSVRTSAGALKITELTPKGTIRKGADTSVEIKAQTSGGSDDGIAECRWRIFEKDYFELFANTNAKAHSHVTSNLSEGDYKSEVKCKDAAGNTAQESSGFTLRIDSSSPKVTRAYNSDGMLKVVTNEEALCYFSSSAKAKCGFSIGEKNVTEMEGASLEHTTTWQKGKTYYIRCQDYRGNENSGCGIIVRTY